MSYGNDVEFSSLLGKTLTEIEGMEKGSGLVRFVTSEGERFLMLHHDDCCESVSIEDVIGDPSDLIGSPLTLAEVSTSHMADPEGYKPQTEYRDDSWTWTFYRIATQKGHVDLRWLGESNGWYSEGVDFEKEAA